MLKPVPSCPVCGGSMLGDEWEEGMLHPVCSCGLAKDGPGDSAVVAWAAARAGERAAMRRLYRWGWIIGLLLMYGVVAVDVADHVEAQRQTPTPIRTDEIFPCPTVGTPAPAETPNRRGLD